MNPAIQKAFEAFWECPKGLLLGDKEDVYKAFCAGYGFARYQAESAQTEAGATPAGSTTTAEDIYAAYPRKVGKRKAIEAISRAAKRAGPKASSATRWCPYELLLERTIAYAEATAKWPQDERQYIPHPSTWFNRGSYEDDPKEWERVTAPASQFSVSH